MRPWCALQTIHNNEHDHGEDAWEDQLPHHFTPRTPCPQDDAPMMVEPGLFIGSFMAEQNKEKLKRSGITHVLQARTGRV